MVQIFSFSLKVFGSSSISSFYFQINAKSLNYKELEPASYIIDHNATYT